MRRRAMVAGALACLPAAALAQFAAPSERSRPAVPRGARDSAVEALRRTVSLVLRAVSRREPLPDAFSNPLPLDDELTALLIVGATLPPDFPATVAPDAVNVRLPHARGNSVWAAAGTWMIEVDPVRMRVVSVAPDVLPPELD